MQLNLCTDYAIRIVISVARSGGILSSAKLAERIGISQSHVIRLSQMLCKGDVLCNHIGVNGGYSLSRPAEKITMYDVAQCMEKSMCVNRRLEPGAVSPRDAYGPCPTHRFYLKLQEAMDTAFRDVTLAGMLASGAETTK